MQCPACRAVYSDDLEKCPRCHLAATGMFPGAENATGLASSIKKEPEPMVTEDAGCKTTMEDPTLTPSTLIEFPGTGRSAMPQWRKDLSERVREIQERRSREAVIEVRELGIRRNDEVIEQQPNTTPLGLVPQPDQPALNPLVAAALKRIERAQQNPMPSSTRSRSRGTSAAVARVEKEQFEVRQEVDSLPLLDPLTDPRHETSPVEVQTEPKRAHTLSVVKSKVIEAEQLPLRESSLAGPIFKSSVSQPFQNQDVGTLAPGEFYDDYAPFFHRFVAGLIDIGVVLFASSPFAAVVELTNADWADERVIVSMSGVFVIVMFLYLTTSTSLGGRTWGMSLLSLRAVDVDSGVPPTTKQSVTRAFSYIISLLTFGLGILYAVVDAEGRTLHDHLSGTTVVRE
jgi:uncharacterized RDD family membrane protein YckC